MNLAAVRRAWREPMLWLVAGLPALGVVAGVVIVVAALRSGGADALSGDVRRSAQVQMENTAADEEALRQGLAAQLVLHQGRGEVELILQQGHSDARQLKLRLLHPGEAARDLELPLQQVGENRWHASLAPLPGNAWTLRLEPPDRRWRLAGRLATDATQARLQPLWQH
jgi:uncharacterized protein